MAADSKRKNRIDRDPSGAASRDYDLIVVGGGITGAMVLWEAARRSKRALLLEKDDFGGATTFNSLKTIHGGLRHLQSLDLMRHRSFVRERRWFLQEFPSLVSPRGMLMPVYGEGLYRLGTLRMALLLDRLLSPDRNAGLSGKSALPDSRIVDVAETVRLFPSVDPVGLQGAALWFDAFIPNVSRVVIEVLARACQAGANALNYVKCDRPVVAGNQISGVEATDSISGKTLFFSGHKLINASGPWARRVAGEVAPDRPSMFFPSMAWNVLFDAPAISDCAVAVKPRKRGGQVYFLHPWRKRLLAGTGHAPRSAFEPDDKPTSDELAEFVDDINLAVPGLSLSSGLIAHVYSGFLPSKTENSDSLALRPKILDHAKFDGPQGMITIVSDKITTSRQTAENAVSALFGSPVVNSEARAEKTPERTLPRDRVSEDAGDEMSDQDLKEIIESESVQHLDDLILRRTAIGDNPARALQLADRLVHLFDWDEPRKTAEVARVKDHYKWYGQRSQDA